MKFWGQGVGTFSLRLSRPPVHRKVLCISEMLCIAEMDQDQNTKLNAQLGKQTGNNNGQFTAQWAL